MTAYWISSYIEVTDEAKLKAYAELAFPALTDAGGTFLARSMPSAVFEAGREMRSVLIEFPSVEAALAAHDSPAYQEALAALDGGAVRDMRIVKAIERVSVLSTDRDGAVSLLTLRRPQRRNALDLELCRAISAAAGAEVAAGARVLVVTGEGTSFCAGADLNGVYGDEFLAGPVRDAARPAGAHLAPRARDRGRQRARHRRRHPAGAGLRPAGRRRDRGVRRPDAAQRHGRRRAGRSAPWPRSPAAASRGA